MTDLLSFVLAAMATLDPLHSHSELASVVADVVEAERPLFAEDDHRHRTASVIVAVLYRESTFDNGAIGDHGNSHCAGQVNLPRKARTREGWNGADLRDDPEKCLTVVMRMLHESFGACRSLPVEERLAVYARGYASSEQGRRLSRDRMRLARRLLAEVSP